MEAKLSILMTTRFFWHLATLPMQFFGQRWPGDLVNRVASNDAVAGLLSDELAVNVINVAAMGFYAAVMSTYDVPLTLFAVGIVAVNLAVLLLASRSRQDANRRLLGEEGNLAGAAVDGVRMIESLKATGAESDFFMRWSGLHANVLHARQRLMLVTTLAGVAPPLLSLLGVIAVLGLGGLRVLDGTLTIGGLVAFQILMQNFSRPVEGLVRFGAHIQTVRGDIARLDDVLQYKPDERAVRGIDGNAADVTAAPPRGSVELDGIAFGYNVKEPPLIEDFSLTIEPGRRVALVGSSGSGKSTVARLVCGLLSPWSGTVRIDGSDLADLHPAHLSERVSYVDQELVLFEGTVRENVSLWDPTVSEDHIVQALRDAAIHDVIASRGRKYDARRRGRGKQLQRRAAPTARDRSRPGPEPGRPRARRGDLGARPGHRGGDRRAPAATRLYLPDHRPPAEHRPGRGRDRRARPGPNRAARHAPAPDRGGRPLPHVGDGLIRPCRLQSLNASAACGGRPTPRNRS